ncbi:hypothetical protein SDC9_205266 [bioreactor metagenome]|uniref:Uncharacterized protein n=1 Tax=bioreactor metagenome TaxID=1076179 RepID=A0A645J386_9ZZZZ
MHAERTGLAEEVAGFADRTDHVVVARVAVTWRYRVDVVPGFVEGWTHQVVHGRVDDGEILAFTFLQVLDLCQQQARIADQTAARLKHHLQAAALQLVE